jgi:hypothetical protein
MTIKVTSNAAEISARLQRIAEKQVPFMVQQAVNKVARNAEQALKNQMDVNFKQPSRFTKSGIVISPAKKKSGKFTAEINLKKSQKRWIGTEIDGGKRGVGAFGFKSVERKFSAWIGKSVSMIFNPKFFRANASGDITLNAMVKFIADVQNDIRKARIPTRVKNVSNYIEGKKYWINLEQGRKLPMGIYMRYGNRGPLGGMGRKLHLMVLFRTSFQYKKRYRYWETARGSIEKDLKDAIKEAWIQAIATAR